MLSTKWAMTKSRGRRFSALMKAIDEEPLSAQAVPGMRFMFLDTGPLDLLTNPRGRKSTYLKHDLSRAAMGASPYERFLPFERHGTVAQYVAVRNLGLGFEVRSRASARHGRDTGVTLENH